MVGVLNRRPRSNFSNPDLSSQAVEAAPIFSDLSYSAATHHHPDAFGGSTYQPVCTLILKVNDTLESISQDLNFSGDTLAEGLVVSTCLGGAFLGCMFSGSIADGLRCRKSFQLCVALMIVGVAMRFHQIL